MEKAPTQVALPKDNPGLLDVEYGYAIQKTRIRAMWYKLLYAADGKPREADDPLLKQSVGLLMPSVKEALELIGLTYGLLNKHAMKTVLKRFPGVSMNELTFRVILTVPATYSDIKRNATVMIAKKHGVASGPFDSIEVISEPEAAALITIYGSVMQDGRLCPFKVSLNVGSSPSLRLAGLTEFAE